MPIQLSRVRILTALAGWPKRTTRAIKPLGHPIVAVSGWALLRSYALRGSSTWGQALSIGRATQLRLRLRLALHCLQKILIVPRHMQTCNCLIGSSIAANISGNTREINLDKEFASGCRLRKCSAADKESR